MNEYHHETCGGKLEIQNAKNGIPQFYCPNCNAHFSWNDYDKIGVVTYSPVLDEMIEETTDTEPEVEIKKEPDKPICGIRYKRRNIL